MHSPSFAFLPSVVVTSGAWFAAFFLGGMVRGGGLPLSPSKSLVLFLFLWSAAGAVRPSDSRSIKRQNCQSANLFIPSVRHATYHEFPTIQKLIKS